MHSLSSQSPCRHQSVANVAGCHPPELAVPRTAERSPPTVHTLPEDHAQRKTGQWITRSKSCVIELVHPKTFYVKLRKRVNVECLILFLIKTSNNTVNKL